jgi:hypothetical protein
MEIPPTPGVCATRSMRLDTRVPLCSSAAARNTAAVDRSALLGLVAQAVAQANKHEPPTDWDREVARVAVRRWQSFSRRHRTDSHTARINDLARGLRERLDPERMDDPGWHAWTADAAAEVLRQHLP